MKYLMIVIISLFLSGCASMQMTPDEFMVWQTMMDNINRTQASYWGTYYQQTQERNARMDRLSDQLLYEQKMNELNNSIRGAR